MVAIVLIVYQVAVINRVTTASPLAMTSVLTPSPPSPFPNEQFGRT